MRYLIIILFFISTNLFSQNLRKPFDYNTNWSIAVGLRTQMMIDDKNGGHLLRSETDEIVFGGFGKMQPGFEILFTYYLNDDKFRIPVSFGYNSYSTKELRYFTASRQFRVQNAIDFFDFRTGFHYSFARFPLANARVYTGLEVAFNFINPSIFERKYTDRFDADYEEVIPSTLKDNAFRIGPVLRLGAEGELQENLMINLSTGLSLVNLLLSDDSRNELMTPTDILPNGESFAYNFTFSFLIQYRL